MNYFKDELLPQDIEAKKILSLNILLSETTPAGFVDEDLDPAAYIVYGEKLHTRFVSIRFHHKPVSKLISKKFISR